MTPEQQRIAIAEACGYRRGESKPLWWATPSGQPFKACGVDSLPDYLNDLNAMREAEETLTSPTTRQAYIENLLFTEFEDPSGDGVWFEQWSICNANAKRRAKAFLQTIGKWTS